MRTSFNGVFGLSLWDLGDYQSQLAVIYTPTFIFDTILPSLSKERHK